MNYLNDTAISDMDDASGLAIILVLSLGCVLLCCVVGRRISSRRKDKH